MPTGCIPRAICLNDGVFKSEINLNGAKIDGDVRLTGARFDGKLGAEVHIGGNLFMNSDDQNKANFGKWTSPMRRSPHNSTCSAPAQWPLEGQLIESRWQSVCAIKWKDQDPVPRRISHRRRDQRTSHLPRRQFRRDAGAAFCKWAAHFPWDPTRGTRPVSRTSI